MDTLQIEEVSLGDLLENVQTSINTEENKTETGELKENILIDLSNQLKKKFDKIANLEVNLINKKKRETKLILKVYGLIKSIEKMTSETIEVPRELQVLIDICTDTIDDFMDGEFFPNAYRLHDE